MPHTLVEFTTQLTELHKLDKMDRLVVETKSEGIINTPNWINWHDMMIVELGGIQKEYIKYWGLSYWEVKAFSPCLSYTMGDML